LSPLAEQQLISDTTLNPNVKSIELNPNTEDLIEEKSSSSNGTTPTGTEMSSSTVPAAQSQVLYPAPDISIITPVVSSTTDKPVVKFELSGN